MTRNEKIARLLGWTVTLGQGPNRELSPTDWYRIVDPSGKEYRRNGLDYALWPEWSLSSPYTGPFPRYDDNADLAIRLPLEEGAGFEIQVYGNTTSARVRIFVSSSLKDQDVEYKVSENPAEAICDAWLAYKTRSMV